MSRAVIYSKRTGRVRSIINAPEYAAYEDFLARVGAPKNPGEAMIEVPEKEFGDLGAVQDFVTRATGLSPSGDRYALVDANGDVKGALIADPDCGDAAPGHSLVAHPEAGSGWRLEAGALVDKRPKPELTAEQIDADIAFIEAHRTEFGPRADELIANLAERRK